MEAAPRFDEMKGEDGHSGDELRAFGSCASDPYAKELFPLQKTARSQGPYNHWTDYGVLCGAVVVVDRCEGQRAALDCDFDRDDTF